LLRLYFSVFVSLSDVTETKPILAVAVMRPRATLLLHTPLVLAVVALARRPLWEVLVGKKTLAGSRLAMPLARTVSAAV
jgi:hypothetical protein